MSQHRALPEKVHVRWPNAVSQFVCSSLDALSVVVAFHSQIPSLRSHQFEVCFHSCLCRVCQIRHVSSNSRN